MANRPVFIPVLSGNTYVATKEVEFEWFPGFAVSQKQKSIISLHEQAKEKLKLASLLEISSKSPEELGVNLSAFNLSFTSVNPAINMSVECAFQGSKVFVEDGPFTDIFNLTSRQAKKDARLKESGPLVEFKFFNTSWPTEPKTAFYDWLYMNALLKNTELVEKLMAYEAFTDIEFNPEKSINCQAYSVALFFALKKRNKLEVLKNKECFLSFLQGTLVNNAREDQTTQPRLI